MEINLTLDDWEECGKEIPTLVNLQPSGTYLMEDQYSHGAANNPNYCAFMLATQ